MSQLATREERWYRAARELAFSAERLGKLERLSEIDTLLGACKVGVTSPARVVVLAAVASFDDARTLDLAAAWERDSCQ